MFTISSHSYTDILLPYNSTTPTQRFEKPGQQEDRLLKL